MNENKIIIYDDALLRKERGIKIANGVVFIFFMLYIIPILYMIALQMNVVGEISSRISETFLPILLFLLVIRINEIHLKHIASIKLYRNRKEGSQPPASA